MTLALTMGMYIGNSEYQHDLHKADDLFFDSAIKHENAEWQIDNKLKKAIKQQQGWIAIYNDTGTLLYQYNVPSSENLTYKHMLKENPFTHRTLVLVEAYEKDPYIVVYSTKNNAAIGLQAIVTSLDWSQEQLPELTTKAIVYYLNADGNVLDTLNIENNNLSIESFVQLQNEEQFETAIHTDNATGKTVIVSYKRIVWDDMAFFSDFKKPLFIGLTIVFLLLIVITWFYAKKFGSPLLIMMQWIRQLGQKNYELPVNKKGEEILFNNKGKVKRKYKLYKELFETLENVTITLKKNEEQQQLMEKTREEWISSLSHDLKTPLSSIIGYVKMLQSDYEWKREEQSQFYEVMDEKSDYMMALIEDLTLTYRLKNGQIPIYKDEIDVNEVIRRTVIQLVNRKDFDGYTFDLKTSQEVILVELDLKWLQRILDNLLINAIKHNPPGTAISVLVTSKQHEVIISICDNGVGMDEKTVEHLFNRYYRGTNTTESIDGTGLGMAITEQLILLQGGTIEVQSQIGQGTRINLVFPTSLSLYD